ncbi:class I SAM-dependent methyltransferase [Candidatus Bathyarchaeota archaeon]|nr:class I SAM-dependent methyltransferase [Candidatus Bathyarchaeota archaeon]
MSKDSSNEFNKISQEYDKGRISEDILFWANEAVKIAKITDKSIIADMGCGTGNYGIGINEVTNSTVIGFDPVSGMLDQAMKKNSQIHFVRAVSEWMPFKDSIFDTIYAAQVWHHISGRQQSAKELYRVLKTNGIKIIHTISHDQLKIKTVFKFFPEILEGQLKAYPSDNELKNLFEKAGFRSFKAIHYEIERYQMADEFIEIAQKKLWSMFRPISQKGLEFGVLELIKWKNDTNNLPIRNDELITLFVAIK